MTRWSVLIILLALLAAAIWAQAQGFGEEENGTSLIIEDDGPPSLLNTPGRPRGSLDGPPTMSTLQSPSVMPGLGADKPDVPKLSEAQAKSVQGAIDHTWNDTGETKIAVIQIEPDGDFVQLIGMSSGVALDYPLATERQKLLAKSIFEALAKYKFTPIKRDLGDGQVSLQVPVVSAKEDVMDAIAVVLVEGFSLRPEATLKIITGEK